MTLSTPAQFRREADRVLTEDLPEHSRNGLTCVTCVRLADVLRREADRIELDYATNQPRLTKQINALERKINRLAKQKGLI